MSLFLFEDPFFYDNHPSKILNAMMQEWCSGSQDDGKCSKEKSKEKQVATKPAFEFNWTPRADVEENEKEFTVSMDLPGISKENAAISLKDGVLTISGKREKVQVQEAPSSPKVEPNASASSSSAATAAPEQQQKPKFNSYYKRIERNFGSFKRAFSLPEGVNPESISANCKDGVLEIKIKKPEMKDKDKVHNIAIF